VDTSPEIPVDYVFTLVVKVVAGLLKNVLSFSEFNEVCSGEFMVVHYFLFQKAKKSSYAALKEWSILALTCLYESLIRFHEGHPQDDPALVEQYKKVASGSQNLILLILQHVQTENKAIIHKAFATLLEIHRHPSLTPYIE